MITKLLDREVDRLQLNYVVRQEVYLRTRNADGKIRGRIPDVSVIDREQWRSDRFEVSALIDPIQLAVEVVSSNWENDYVDKLDEYQCLGIKEYWIVDYLACCEADPCGIGSRNILGEPKFPTVSIYTLNPEGIYERQGFQGDQQLISLTFPELSLTAQQLFET